VFYSAAHAPSYPRAASQSGRSPSSLSVCMRRRGVPRSRQATPDNRMTARVRGRRSNTAREKLACGGKLVSLPEGPPLVLGPQKRREPGELLVE